MNNKTLLTLIFKTYHYTYIYIMQSSIETHTPSVHNTDEQVSTGNNVDTSTIRIAVIATPEDINNYSLEILDTEHYAPNDVSHITENVVTNITSKLFKEIGKTRPFTIFARTIKFRKIHESYSKAIDFKLPKEKREEDGKKLALFNSAGHLELAVYKSNPLTVGSASSLFGLDYRDPITIKFD